jgi:TPR repeat protein
MSLTLKEIYKKYNIFDCGDKIKGYEHIVLEIFNLTELDVGRYDLENDNILIIIGLYYFHVKKDYELMKKYLLISIEKGCSVAIYNLGCYYLNIEKDYDLMKKYYLMAIEKDCVFSMHSLAYYYEVIEKKYDLMKKYYLMAIEKGFPNSMFYLGNYYEEIEKDYDLMKKYYLPFFPF